MAQAALATLLQLEEHAGKSDARVSPLLKYAAQHWVDHAQFEKVSSRVREGMDDLFDSSKPHFVAWLKVHDIDRSWESFTPSSYHGVSSPLYYASFCGFYELAESLIMKHSEQVNGCGGRILAPLPAALSNRHFRVANLLYRHGALVDIQDYYKCTPLYIASCHGQVDIVRWLLNHGADASSRSIYDYTPLSNAASAMQLEAVQVLLEHNADVNSRNYKGGTPLYEACQRYCDPMSKGKVADIVRRLLEHRADPNICDNHHHSTPLHLASSRGFLEAARLLLSYGAKVDEKDKNGKTPFQLAASQGHDQITKLLLEHGAVPRQ